MVRVHPLAPYFSSLGLVVTGRERLARFPLTQDDWPAEICGRFLNNALGRKFLARYQMTAGKTALNEVL